MAIDTTIMGRARLRGMGTTITAVRVITTMGMVLAVSHPGATSPFRRTITTTARSAAIWHSRCGTSLPLSK